LREIVHHMKNMLYSYREMGFDPPPLSPPALAYLGKHSPGIASLEDLRRHVGNCKRCGLSEHRKHLVFGEGSPQARLVFVGEGPGREEDLEGRPFVGEAGKLLTRIIHAMGLSREEVYICNVVKCRPPGNRDPRPEEIEMCLPFLNDQLHLIRPQVICTLGRIAAQVLLQAEIKITRDRGKWSSYGDIPLMPTYHPAYLIRNPSEKRPVWEDIQQIMKHMGLEVKRNG
jgi:DNA polymerase